MQHTNNTFFIFYFCLMVQGTKESQPCIPKGKTSTSPWAQTMVSESSNPLECLSVGAGLSQSLFLCSVSVLSLCCLCAAGDIENQAELEEKTRLINQVLELQHTLEGKACSVQALRWIGQNERMCQPCSELLIIQSAPLSHSKATGIDSSYSNSWHQNKNALHQNTV